MNINTQQGSRGKHKIRFVCFLLLKKKTQDNEFISIQEYNPLLKDNNLKVALHRDTEKAKIMLLKMLH